MADISQHKQALRQTLCEKRASLSEQQRQDYSAQIQSYVWQWMKDKGVQQLLVYKALPIEVNTDALLTPEASNAYEVFVPRMLSDTDMQWVKVDANTRWKQARFGVLEPEDGQIWKPQDLNTLMLCPLLGFDMQGHRLGMGKGYFDRWLAKYGQYVEVAGLAFHCQMLPKIPVEPHDVPLSTIVTEQGMIHAQ
jgi:5-formyltetrahydrofolate cyclo-ligase